MDYFLGIDIGGTITKAGLYTADGREVGVIEQDGKMLAAQPGFTERDMNELWASVCHVVRQVIHTNAIAAGAIRGVSFSSHGKGLYAIDNHGQPVRNGIISSDTRALALVQQWRDQQLDQRTYQRGLQQLWCGHPVSLLHWLKLHEPQNYERIAAVLMVHDYVRFRMTGEIAAEVTNISGSNLYNQHTGDYDASLMADFGIPEVAAKTAPIIGSSQLAGHVTASAAEACGLLPGTAVYGGLFDVVASAVCSGVSDEKTLSAVAGTWSIATCVTDRVVAAQHPYVWGSYCIPGKYFVHEGSPTSAANLTWFMRNLWGDDRSRYAEFDQWVTQRRHQASDIVFLPYLFGSNLDLSLSGSLIGLRGHHGMPDVVNAIYQGIVFSHLLHQDRILQLNPQVERIRITGGPTHSAPWMQMFADGGNLPLEVVDIQQCGCRAAALCAAVGAGFYADFAEATSATQPAVRTFLPQAAGNQQLRQQMVRYLKVAKALSEVEHGA